MKKFNLKLCGCHVDEWLFYLKQIKGLGIIFSLVNCRSSLNESGMLQMAGVASHCQELVQTVISLLMAYSLIA